MTNIYLIRHGEAEGNLTVCGKATGMGVSRPWVISRLTLWLSVSKYTYRRTVFKRSVPRSDDSGCHHEIS